MGRAFSPRSRDVHFSWGGADGTASPAARVLAAWPAWPEVRAPDEQHHRAQVQRLFTDHQPALRSCVLSIVRDFALAQDVVQETFLAVTRKAGQFDLATNFLAWACAIARSEALAALRRANRPAIGEETLELLLASEAAAAPDYRADWLSRCLARLTPTVQKMLRLLSVPKVKPPVTEPKEGLAGKEEIKVTYDLIVAALQTDTTRVLTYRQPVGTLLQSLDIKVAPHDTSHYSAGPRMDASRKRDATQSELLAGLIDKLKATKEADGRSLFDHTALAFGSNIRTIHYLDNCPHAHRRRRRGLEARPSPRPAEGHASRERVAHAAARHRD